MMYEANILIVDDEIAIIDMVKTILDREGFKHVDTAVNGEQVLRYITNKEYDLILLDVMLPDQSGFELCAIIRQRSSVPIFFLTAKETDVDKLAGFAYGADDYITKPFNPLELVARMKAQLNRTYARNDRNETRTVFDYGRFSIDTTAAELNVAGKGVDCSARLFQLLVFFCKNPHQVFTKEHIYEKVWAANAFTDDNTVVVHIRRLREKIEKDPGKPEYIQTVRGLGYKFIPSDHQ